ncbi:MAG: RNA polymerase sigma factor [Phycisphaerae bacterium]
MSHGPEDTDAPKEERLVALAPRVYGFLVRLVGNRETAEDLTQETLLRALRGFAAYRPEGKFRAWVFRIATNAARDWIRRRPREPALGLETDADAPLPGTVGREPPPEARLLAGERIARVEAALARLSEPDREVLLMRYYGELEFKDIARATGEPLGTVLARAHRALKKLANLVPQGEEK